MTTTDKPTLLQALDKEIEALNSRASTMIQLLKRDALSASKDFQRIAESTGLDDLVSPPSEHTMLTVLAWQDRLEELRRQHDALVMLRDSYRPAVTC